MRKFQAIQVHDQSIAPFDTVFLALDRSKIDLYRAWCYKNLGMPVDVQRDGQWYEKGGYFFFSNLKTGLQLVESGGPVAGPVNIAAIDGSATCEYDRGVKSSGHNPVRELNNKLHSAFGQS